MRIHLTGDHHGDAVARALRETLTTRGHEVLWHGPPARDDGDDYPAPAIAVAQAVVSDEDSDTDALGVVVGGDGAGETVAANKVVGTRAALGWTAEAIARARRHVGANVLVVPASHLLPEDVDQVVEAFVRTEFVSSLDDARRLINIAEYEVSGTIEGWALGEPAAG